MPGADAKANKGTVGAVGAEEKGEEWDPAGSLAELRHEFGEHGGVNMSIENSATFTVMSPETMARIFRGRGGARRRQLRVQPPLQPHRHAPGPPAGRARGDRVWVLHRSAGSAAPLSSYLGSCPPCLLSQRLYSTVQYSVV